MLVGWLFAALRVSGKFCQIGSFKGGKATYSFDVKQECYIITVENNVHILPDPAYLPGLCVALSVKSNWFQSVYLLLFLFQFQSLSTNFGF